MEKDKTFPLVYSCSGCADVAQVANQVALELDRGGVAEMSCIAGVGGDVPGLVQIARSGRPIIGLDGCALACVKNCLAERNLVANHYFRLDDLGLERHKGRDAEASDVKQALEWVVKALGIPAWPWLRR